MGVFLVEWEIMPNFTAKIHKTRYNLKLKKPKK